MIRLTADAALASVLDKQHLAGWPADPRLVMDDLVGLHATIPRSAYLQLRARVPGFATGQLDALLDAGRAARVPGMRRTLFIESAELVPIVFAATRGLTARDHPRYLAANGLTPRRLEQLAGRIDAALAGRALDVRGLRAAIGTTDHVSAALVVLCDQGRLVRWKGAGGWGSTRPTYRRLADVLPSADLGGWDTVAAVRELVERYVRGYGPVRESDVAWWTGLPRATVRDAIAALPQLVEVHVEGWDGTLLLHEADVGRAGPAAPGVSLLPVLDPFLQGYRDRARSVDPSHLPYVVDRSGNVTSTILVAGRVAGVWDVRAGPAPEVRLLFLTPPGAATRRRARTLAADTGAFLLGETPRVVEVDRMAPLTGRGGRFQSPLADPA